MVKAAGEGDFCDAVGGTAQEIAGFFSGSGGMLWGQKRKRVCKQADQQPDHFQFPAGSLFAVKCCGSFQDICTFIPVRCAGVKLPAVYRHYKKYRWVRNLTKAAAIP